MTFGTTRFFVYQINVDRAKLYGAGPTHTFDTSINTVLWNVIDSPWVLKSRKITAMNQIGGLKIDKTNKIIS